MYDVIVLGGGLSGVLAAVSAAREGKKTLILEKYGFLGGTAVMALVNPFMHYRTQGVAVNNAGLFEQLLERLAAMGGLHANQVVFNEQLLSIVLDDMVREAGVELLLHTQLAYVQRTGERITKITALGLSGEMMTLEAAVYVDATGDAELAALSGLDMAVGRDEKQACQPMTMCLRIGNVDEARCAAAAKEAGLTGYNALLDALFVQAKARGEVTIPRENVLAFSHMTPGVIHFNTTRVLGIKPFTSKEMTLAEIEGRRQAYEFYCFLRKRVPGFENCTLLQLPAQIGVRESRRLRGAYVLTCADVDGCAKFEDSIARACYGVDIHNPVGEGTERRLMAKGTYHTIPMRCLYCKELSNLVVTGRPISTDHAAYSAIRIMPICASLGEAAGILAALGAKTQDVRCVPAGQVQALLTAHGAVY